jgi:hypothetical protein
MKDGITDKQFFPLSIISLFFFEFSLFRMEEEKERVILSVPLFYQAKPLT